jgi:hypothetical protein
MRLQNLNAILAIVVGAHFGVAGGRIPEQTADRRFLKGNFGFVPSFAHMSSIQATAAAPWPGAAEADNLCQIARERSLRVTIVMGSDRAFAERTARCVKPRELPVRINTAYANRYNYSLRLYIDEDVPFIMRHGKNALAGELRKVWSCMKRMVRR